ncbi:MAG: hypothetical protein AB7N65_19830 [Vicinamibacterales bacterium]
MRTRLPFLLLAAVIIALVLPVGSALSFSATSRSRRTPASVAPPGYQLVVAHDAVTPTGPAVPPPDAPAARRFEALRLFCAGSLLLGMAGVARLGK